MNWSRFSSNLGCRQDVGVICLGLGFDDVGSLVAASLDRGVGNELLVRLVGLGPVGVEVALAVMGAEIRVVARGVRAWTGEDAEELLLTAVWERLVQGNLPRGAMGAVMGQARKTVVRALQGTWAQACLGVPVVDEVFGSVDDVEEEVLDRLSQVELVEWVMSSAEIDGSSARIVVNSRAHGVPIEAVAAAEGLSYHAAYRRRARAEEKLVDSVQNRPVVLTIT